MPTKTKVKPKPPAPPGVDALLDERQVAAALSISPRTVRMMVASGAMPAPDVGVLSRKRWRTSALNAYIASLPPPQPRKP